MNATVIAVGRIFEKRGFRVAQRRDFSKIISGDHLRLEQFRDRRASHYCRTMYERGPPPWDTNAAYTARIRLR